MRLRRTHGLRSADEAVRALQEELPELTVASLGELVSISVWAPTCGSHHLGRYDLRALLKVDGVPDLGPGWIEEYVRAEVLPQSWDLDPSCSMMVSKSGMLWLTHTHRAHVDLCALLDLLAAEEDPWAVIEARQGR